MKTPKAILVKLHSSDVDTGTGSEDERRNDLDGNAVGKSIIQAAGFDTIHEW